jgi:hypothetical protein
MLRQRVFRRPQELSPLRTAAPAPSAFSGPSAVNPQRAAALGRQLVAGSALRLVTLSRLNALITVMAQATTRYCSSVKALTACS